MRVLIAEDDPVSRRVIEATLSRAGYQPVVVADGAEALAAFETDDPPHLVVLDWMMPELEGPELCRRLRARDDGDRFYVVLLTAKVQKVDIVTGLRAGADDYLTKPFHHAELLARLAAGRRIIELQERLAVQIRDLQEALDEVDRLSGLLPICAYCKRVREGDDYWQAVEEYVANRTAAQFSHAVCPQCFDRVVRPQIEAMPDA